MNVNFRPPAQAELVAGAGQRAAARQAPPLAGPRRAVPSISGLIAFEATARYLSFSHAARELTLTQGAVSKRVRQLESVLGVALLTRSRHKVVLTEAGRHYLNDVRRLLGEIQAATQSLQAGSRRPTITLAAPSEITTYWLMPRLGDFYARYPEITVNLVCARTTDDAWQPADCECAIQCVEETAGVAWDEVLFEEELVPVATPQFLADNPVDTPAGLLEARLILQNSPHDAWYQWFAVHGLSVDGRLNGNRHDCLSLVLEAALNGHGVALAPVQAVRDLIDQERLRTIVNTRLATDRTYVLTIHPAFAEHTSVRRFQHWIAGMADRQQ